MTNVNLDITMKSKSDGSYGVFFMGGEIISFSKSVYESDGDKIYEALANMFTKGLEIGVKAAENGLSGVRIDAS